MLLGKLVFGVASLNFRNKHFENFENFRKTNFTFFPLRSEKHFLFCGFSLSISTRISQHGWSISPKIPFCDPWRRKHSLQCCTDAERAYVRQKIRTLKKTVGCPYPPSTPPYPPLPPFDLGLFWKVGLRAAKSRFGMWGGQRGGKGGRAPLWGGG